MSSSPSSTPRHLQFPHSHINIPPQFHSMTAGAGAGLIASITTCPLDVVKTRLQAQHLSKGAEGYEGVGMIVRRIWSAAGPKGFYRGLGPTLAGYLPTWGIYFTVYDLVKDRLGGWASEQEILRGNTAIVHIFAAMTAGATGTIMTNPLWVVKTRFMAQAGTADSKNRYRTTIGAIRSIYKTEGFRAFYKGLLPSLMGVSHVAVQFPLYEKAKSWADAGDGDHSSLPPSTILACSAFSKMVASVITYPHEVLRTRLQIRKSASASPSSAASSTSSASATSTVPSSGSSSKSTLHPQSKPTPSPAFTPTPGHVQLYSPLVTGNQPPHIHNHLYTSAQSQSQSHLPPSIRNPLPNPLPRIELPKPPWYKKMIHSPREGGVIDTFLAIERQDGWKGFYRGLSINLIRTVPNSAVTMLTYELIMRRLSLPE